MIKACYDIYIPLQGNDGIDFPQDVLDRVRDELIDLFGGVSIIPFIDGYWKDDEGKLYQDQIVIHRVVCECSPRSRAIVNRMHKWLLAELNQHQIFILMYTVNVEELTETAADVYNNGN